jgi:hypothetical protein
MKIKGTLAMLVTTSIGETYNFHSGGCYYKATPWRPGKTFDEMEVILEQNPRYLPFAMWKLYWIYRGENNVANFYYCTCDNVNLPKGGSHPIEKIQPPKSLPSIAARCMEKPINSCTSFWCYGCLPKQPKHIGPCFNHHTALNPNYHVPTDDEKFAKPRRIQEPKEQIEAKWREKYNLDVSDVVVLRDQV